MAVVLDSIHRDLETLARSDPTEVGGSLQIPERGNEKAEGKMRGRSGKRRKRNERSGNKSLDRQEMLTNLESGWTPIDELDGSLLLDGSNSRGDVLWDDISSVEKTTRHETSVSWVTLKERVKQKEAKSAKGHFHFEIPATTQPFTDLDHLVTLLERRESHLSNGVLLVEGLLGRDDWSVGS